MNPQLLLSIVMLVTGLVFLILSFFLPNEIGIGAFIASLVISGIFYRQHKKSKRPIVKNDDL